MSSAPTESRIFAARYSREANRLEKLHCNHLFPGTSKWGDAMIALEDRMVKLGGPIKRTTALREACKYLRSAQRESSMHFVLGFYGTKRSSALHFATINFGHHPLLGVNEDGVSIMEHSIICRRNGSGGTLANCSIGYVSRHAIQRLHERNQGLTMDTATEIFTCIGMLGYLMKDSDKHIEGGMCLRFDDILAIGTIRRAVGVSTNNCCTLFEVRTFLPAYEINDPAIIRQGNIAFDALNQWLESTNHDPIAVKTMMDKIPSRPNREDDFVRQTAVKVSAA